MHRISSIIFAIIVCVLLALPVLSTSAAPRPPQSAPVLQQATQEPIICTDDKLVNQIVNDVNSALDDLAQVAKTGAGGVFKIMANLADTRQKYEDMELPQDQACTFMIFDTITLISNISDQALIEMADKLGFDPAGIAKARATQKARTSKWIGYVNSYIAGK
jgi:hypothetical protein